jgi:hypothetical protein
VALARYAGKLGGFYPEDPIQALCVDQALDTLNDLTSLVPRSKDPEELKKLREDFQAGTLTKYAMFLDGLIQKNGVGFASTPSIADISLKLIVEGTRSGIWDHIDPTFFETYEGIVAAVDAIAKNDKVVAYYASKK